MLVKDSGGNTYAGLPRRPFNARRVPHPLGAGRGHPREAVGGVQHPGDVLWGEVEAVVERPCHLPGGKVQLMAQQRRDFCWGKLVFFIKSLRHLSGRDLNVILNVTQVCFQVFVVQDSANIDAHNHLLCQKKQGKRPAHNGFERKLSAPSPPPSGWCGRVGRQGQDFSLATSPATSHAQSRVPAR